MFDHSVINIKVSQPLIMLEGPKLLLRELADTFRSEHDFCPSFQQLSVS